jgi:hypothetical protein
MQSIKIGDVKLSRLLLGSNPFSGFSHQGHERDHAMLHYFTAARIKKTLFKAEKLGITGLVARTDVHVTRLLLEYRDDGGKLKWLAQTCPEVGSFEFCIERAARAGAVACHLHGGVMDYLTAQGKGDEAKRAIDLIRKKKMLAGLAGHTTRVFEWAEKNADADYYMCCYYNPTPRDTNPEHVHGANEVYLEEDRKAMTDLIQSIRRPVIHYKIFAAGRNDPEQAFAYACSKMRPQDLTVIGVFPKDNPKMLKEDVKLFQKYSKVAKG